MIRTCCAFCIGVGFGLTTLVLSCFGESEVLFAEDGNFQLVSIPQQSPAPGYLATKIQVRVDAPWPEKVITLENIQVYGAHQVWGESDDVITGNSPGPPVIGTDFDDSWASLDSHLLITQPMVGGSAGDGFRGIMETNNGATTAELGLADAPTSQARAGFGSVTMQSQTDAFFLDTPFQFDRTDYAYLVTKEGNDVTLVLGVYEESLVHGEPRNAAFGFGVAVGVQVVHCTFVFNIQVQCAEILDVTKTTSVEIAASAWQVKEWHRIELIIPMSGSEILS